MRKRINWFQIASGIKKDHLKHRYRQDITGYLNTCLNSGHPPIELGRLEDGKPFYVSVEQLMNAMHFMAASKKGKSTSFLGIAEELIKRGFGLFNIDQSDGGDTAKKLLGICQRYKKKYLYIDLNLDYNPVINPFDFNDIDKSIVYLKDAFQVLFSVKDSASTSNISRYLPAILQVLMDAKMSIVEAKYFTLKIYAAQRNYILEQAKKNESSPHRRLTLEDVYFNARMYDRFVSTTGRLEPTIHPAIEALFGHKSTVNLAQMIQNNYTIIVNLALEKLDELQKRFVGTVLINLILYHHRSGKHYWLFVDEAQDYANQKLGEMLDKKAKSNLHVGLLNHHLEQFEDKKLQTSVKVNTPIKFEFPKKQEAWVTLNEMDPVYLRMPHVYTKYGTPTPSEFTRERKIILHKISKRIPYDLPENPPPVKSRTTPDRPATRQD